MKWMRCLVRPSPPASTGRLNGLVLAWLMAALAHPAVAENWPAWRGPDGNGICGDHPLPIYWSTKQNVRWRVPMPGPGNSTPIVLGERVFITQAISKENRRTVMCFDRRDGKELWQAGTTWGEKDSGGSANPPCTPSPVTDGERVIAWFGSAGIFCFDLDGHELWRRDLGRQSHGWGYASSPVLYRDLCLLNFGPGQRSFLIALDKRTGRTVWQYDVPAMAPDAKWEDYGGDLKDWKRLGSPTMPEVSGSCATPLVVRAAGRDEVVVSFPLRVMAFAPETGKPLWTCGGLNTGAYSSPFFGEGVVGVTGNGLRSATMAIRPGGRGDVAATHRLWHLSPAASKACIGSGLISGGHIYQVTMMGFLQCLDLKTGQTVWDERLSGPGAKNSSWSSPLLAGDRLYVPNQNGDVFVVRAGPKFDCLATNSIGGEPMNASLAVSDGAVFIRTHKNLWCIAEGKKTNSPSSE
ncbi:MAG: PQQ-binding-like beta-propeller repeat protein [Verrucomicrobia bacterium]|nr:PQQ-binding-like beta-propeller repeat protein [Verrucomicrobiota bacterium]